MMEAGWSARRVAHQLGHSDCVVKRCWDQWIREMSFTHRPGSRRPGSGREDRHIIRNACTVKCFIRHHPGTESTLTRGPVSSRTIQRPLDEGHLGSRHTLRVLPLTPTHQCLRLEWCCARENWTAVEWNQIVFSDECRFNLISDDNRVHVWKACGLHLNPVFALQRHTAPTAGVMVWGTIAYNTQSPLVLIRGTMTVQRYVHEILQPHVLPLMQQLPGALFQQDNVWPHMARVSVDCLHTITTLPWPAQSPDLSPIEHIWDHLGRRVGHPMSLNKLEARLQKIWNKMSQDIIQNLNVSMPDRFASCIQARGESTGY
ncbi:transposable element Tcb2 transposase [Trichonephila clavipes]|nr:transposable element Tcb2 transposase [Trichonephila clavipes]